MLKTATEQATSPSPGGSSGTAASRNGRPGWGERVVKHPNEFSRGIRQELFVTGKNLELSGAAKVEADLVCLDREGNSVVVVCERKREESCLARGLACAGIIAGWKPQDFYEGLPAQAVEELRAFLRVRSARMVQNPSGAFSEIRPKKSPVSAASNRKRTRSRKRAGTRARRYKAGRADDADRKVGAGRGLEKINRDQRLILIAERYSPGLLTAAEWLNKQQAIDVRCFRVCADARREAAVPSLSYQQVFPSPPPELEWSAPVFAGLRQAGQSIRKLVKVPSARRWAPLAAAVLIVLCLGMWPDAEAPRQAVEISHSGEDGGQAASPRVIGHVEDSATRLPVADAKVFYAGKLTRTNATGLFHFDRVPGEETVLVKAAGYRSSNLTVGAAGTIRLEPLEVRALFLSHASLGNPARRESVLNLIRNSSSNAVVVGFKSVEGRLAAPVDHEVARQIGALDRLPVPDLAATVARWKAEGIYTIALVVLFKDNLIVQAAPELALRSLKSRRIIRDQYGVTWTDPAARLIRNYNIKVAAAAAAAGFDEIQFDFVRYPAETLSFEGAGPEENQRRLATVSQFLRRVTDVLAPYNVSVGASIFGSVCTIREIGPIGQDLEEFAAVVDYVSPMLYPSYFAPSKPSPEPMQHPYKVVYDSLREATNRLKGHSRMLRPWLQNFPDRASPEAPLDAANIRAQMQASQDAQSNGWMLWDAGNRYHNTLEALRGLPARKHRTVASVTSGEAGEGSSSDPFQRHPRPSEQRTHQLFNAAAQGGPQALAVE